MTPRSHPTLEHLADFTEELLEPDEHVAVERHVAECRDCRVAVEELTGVGRVLQHVGAHPLFMPDDVSERLEAALADESRDRSRTTGVASMEAARSTRKRRGRGVVKGLVAAATVAVLAVGGGVAYQSFVAGGTNDPTAGRERTDPPVASAPSDFTLSKQNVPLSRRGFEDDVRGAVEPSATPQKSSKPDSGGRHPTKGPETPETPVKPPGGRQGYAPDSCLADAIGVDPRKVMDSTTAKYGTKSVTLVITRGEKPGQVHAYAVEGCPGTGKVVHEAEVSVAR